MVFLMINSPSSQRQPIGISLRQQRSARGLSPPHAIRGQLLSPSSIRRGPVSLLMSTHRDGENKYNLNKSSFPSRLHPPYNRTPDPRCLLSSRQCRNLGGSKTPTRSSSLCAPLRPSLFRNPYCGEEASTVTPLRQYTAPVRSAWIGLARFRRLALRNAYRRHNRTILLLPKTSHSSPVCCPRVVPQMLVAASRRRSKSSRSDRFLASDDGVLSILAWGQSSFIAISPLITLRP